MPKAKGRKKVGSAYIQPNQAVASTRPAAESADRATIGRRGSTRGSGGAVQTPLRVSQGLFMSVLVALGCWGLAAFFFFFTADLNHYLFGGMAALMALMWSFSFVIRLRKMLLQQQK